MTGPSELKPYFQRRADAFACGRIEEVVNQHSLPVWYFLQDGMLTPSTKAELRTALRRYSDELNANGVTRIEADVREVSATGPNQLRVLVHMLHRAGPRLAGLSRIYYYLSGTAPEFTIDMIEVLEFAWTPFHLAPDWVDSH